MANCDITPLLERIEVTSARGDTIIHGRTVSSGKTACGLNLATRAFTPRPKNPSTKPKCFKCFPCVGCK